MNPSPAFLDGLARGLMAGSIALLAGLFVADAAASLDQAPWITAGLGIWAFLIVIAVLRPGDSTE